MTALSLGGNISPDTLMLLATVVAVLGLFFQYNRNGSQAVQLLQVRVDNLNELLDAAKAAVTDLQAKNTALTEAAHQAELTIKDREREIAELRARPDTQKMLDAFEMNQAAVLRALGDISAALETLINRDQQGRRTDS